MSYTADTGAIHSNSYWIVGHIGDVDLVKKEGRITFFGYNDLASLLSGARVIGTQSYSLAGSDYVTYLENPAKGIGFEGLDLIGHLFKYVDDNHDFFNGAIDVE